GDSPRQLVDGVEIDPSVEVRYGPEPRREPAGPGLLVGAVAAGLSRGPEQEVGGLVGGMVEHVAGVHLPRTPALVRRVAGAGAAAGARDVQVDAVVEIDDEGGEQRLVAESLRVGEDGEAEVDPDAVVGPVLRRGGARDERAGRADEVLDVAAAVFGKREV